MGVANWHLTCTVCRTLTHCVADPLQNIFNDIVYDRAVCLNSQMVQFSTFVLLMNYSWSYAHDYYFSCEITPDGLSAYTTILNLTCAMYHTWLSLHYDLCVAFMSSLYPLAEGLWCAIHGVALGQWPLHVPGSPHGQAVRLCPHRQATPTSHQVRLQGGDGERGGQEKRGRSAAERRDMEDSLQRWLHR